MQLSRAVLNLWPQHKRVSWREDSSTVMWQTNSAVAERAAFARTFFDRTKNKNKLRIAKSSILMLEKAAALFSLLCILLS